MSKYDIFPTVTLTLILPPLPIQSSTLLDIVMIQVEDILKKKIAAHAVRFWKMFFDVI